jgi:hypothetical protein
MALMRCRSHAPVTAAGKHIAAVQPIGFPQSALVCSSEHCEQPAFIWLEGAEKVDYDSGTRVFRVSVDTIKVRCG